MNFKSLADRAKQLIDQRGGTEGLKQEAERLRGIATGPGTAQEKAKRAREALKQPGGDGRSGTTRSAADPSSPL